MNIAKASWIKRMIAVMLVSWSGFTIMSYSDTMVAARSYIGTSLGLLKIFVQVHFEDQFAMNPKLLNNKTEFMKLATEYSNCFYQYLR